MAERSRFDGRDAGLLRATKLEVEPTNTAPELIDLGRVGTVDAVDATIVRTLERSEIIPVVAPVGYGPSGVALNINADLVAQQLAIELQAERLLLMTDVDGVKTKRRADSSARRGDVDALSRMGRSRVA